MQLKPEQLTASLQKKLAPVYFLAGDEPLQLLEMADAIRAAARSAGFLSRELLAADAPGFSWSHVTELASTSSIFADKQVLDLRLPTGSPGAEGAKALTAYCQKPPADSLLLISAGKINKDVFKSRWFQAVDKTGVVCQAWPLSGKALSAWLQQRLARRGLLADAEGVSLLTARIEGNLLAAAQEVEKLYALYGSGPVSGEQIDAAVADNSRYNVFSLTDACLAAEPGRIMKILAGLAHEGIAAPIVVWALSREIRMLYKIKWALREGQSLDQTLNGQHIPAQRQPLVSHAVKRLSMADLNRTLALTAQADRQSKGQESGDAWASLRQICLLLASTRILIAA